MNIYKGQSFKSFERMWRDKVKVGSVMKAKYIYIYIFQRSDVNTNDICPSVWFKASCNVILCKNKCLPLFLFPDLHHVFNLETLVTTDIWQAK